MSSRRKKIEGALIPRGYFLVGDAPPRDQLGCPHLWLTPDRSTTMHTANLLMRLAGYSMDQYLRIFTHRTNLFPVRRNRWASTGKMHADAIQRQAAACEAFGIVVIGQETAAHFGLKEWPYFVWSGESIRPVAIIPHPSGRSSFWAESDSKERAARFFRGINEAIEQEVTAEGQ